MAKLEDDLKVKVKVASPEIRVGTTVMNSMVFKEIIHNNTLIGNGDKEPLGVAPEILSDISTAKSDIAGLKTDLSTTDANITQIDEKFENYLPLSGGTLTGQLGINSKGYIDHPILMDAYDELQIGYHSPITDSLITVFRFKLGNGMFLPYANKVATLGDSTRIWKTVYSTKLNNGADLIVPTEGGTLARVEDIDAIGGDGTAGQVLTKTADGMAWQDASGGGDYLPLAGGEMSGPIAFSGTDYSIKYDASKHGVVVYTSDARGFVFSNSGYGTFYSTSYNADIGQANNKWRRVYVTKMNNGADLNVPTEGGTIARIEDIDAVVGDISTALTAILGE